MSKTGKGLVIFQYAKTSSWFPVQNQAVSGRIGRPGRTRTYDQSVMSALL
jgi:hypothetical protein